jgi:TonB family protein
MVAFAGVSNADLQREYGDKVLTIRQFYPGLHLRFDSSGNILGKASPGAWTIDRMVRVENVSVSKDGLRIRGQRLFLIHDPATNQMRDVRTFTKADWFNTYSKLEIDIESGQAPLEMTDVERLMRLVFLSPDEKLVDAVPDYWKDWLMHGQGWKPSLPDTADQPQKVGGNVTAPHLVYGPDPQYSEAARQAKYQGTCILWMVVGADGLVHDIRISRALGLGLDDQAVRTVRTWKFRPALKDGALFQCKSTLK